MSLSSDQLDAFFEVTKTRSFSKAASNLHLSQPAFSQRISNLEKSMGITLIIRDPSGLRLTEAGDKLLRYCQTKAALERETLGTIFHDNELAGEIRIGGYSSIFRSLVMPALTGLIRQNAKVHVECFVREMYELPGLLRSGEAEFIFLDHALSIQGIEAVLVGHENYVLVEPKIAHERANVYLDHDPEDRLTEKFLEKKGQRHERSFLGDIYGLIDGVERGWGRAVLPLHLVKNNRKVRIVNEKKSLKMPIYLHYHHQPYLTALQKKVIEAVTPLSKFE